MNITVLESWNKEKKRIAGTAKKIYILASFTANTVEPYLGEKFSKNGTPFLIDFAPYNQIMQELNNKNSMVYSDESECVLIWQRIEECANHIISQGYSDYSDVYNLMEGLMTSIINAQEATGKKFIVMLPTGYVDSPLGVGDWQSVHGLEMFSNKVRMLMLEKLCGRNGIYICDSAATIRQIPYERAEDSTMYAMAKIPYTDEVFDKIASQIVRVYNLSVQKKIYAIDVAALIDKDYDVLENIEKIENINIKKVSEDDLLHSIQESFNMFSRWEKEIVLCTASGLDSLESLLNSNKVFLNAELLKNACTDCTKLSEVISKIRQRYGDQEYELVYVSPRCGEVENIVKVIHLTEEQAQWQKVIMNSPLFDSCLENNIEQKFERTRGGNSFYTNLDLEIDIKQAESEQFEQVQHLLDSVSEFRCLPTKWTDEAIKNLLEDQERKVICVYVRDRYGNYGCAGLVICNYIEQDVIIEDFMLNCRVLGKKAEYLLLKKLIRTFTENNYNLISILYSKSDRNEMVADFLSIVTGIPVAEILDNKKIVVNMEELNRRNEKHLFAEQDVEVDIPHDEEISGNFFKDRWEKKSVEQKNRIFNNIPLIKTYQDLIDEINCYKSASRSAECEYVEPRTETERKLVDLWEEILHVDKIGVLDNFFKLGGTSILATRLIVRFKDEFKIQMPIRLFFDKNNIEQMASYIDTIDRNYDEEKYNAESIQNYRYYMKTYLNNEIKLDDDICIGDIQPCKSTTSCEKVLLTGVTGFLGAFLLDELINNTNFKIHCLVRAENNEKAHERIRNNLEFYGLWKNSYVERVEVICGDLTEKYMGLSKDNYFEMAQEIDMIYHNGADTNFLKPYVMLKKPNVDGTKEVLRFATIEKLKKVQFVSTHYVFSTISNSKETKVMEQQIPTTDEVLIMGYQQTKLVCEQLIQKARERGIPTNIFRPGRISGSTINGACQHGDFVWQMTKCCVESGIMFSDYTEIELIPVDFVAKAIVAASLHKKAENRNYHIINKKKTSMKYFVSWMDERGFKVEQYPYLEWKDKLTDIVAKNDQLDSVKMMLPFITEDADSMDVSLDLDTSNIDEVLFDSGIERKEVDKEMFEKYLDYFIETGFFAVRKDI